MTKIDPFDDQRRKGARHAHLSKEQKKKIWAFRAILWDAIDNKKEISIIELEKELGIER